MTTTRPKCCAIIPARGGSKGIIGKNLRVVAGKPLVAHAIEAARAAQCIDRVVVSTDDPAIAEAAREWGAEAIARPAELSTDTASSEAALLHALDVLAGDGYEPELLVFLQCTSPLTSAADIDGAVEQLVAEQGDCALAVTDFHYFLWGNGGDGEVVGINHDPAVRLMRQQREPQFLETGAIYVMRTAGFRAAKHRFFGKIVLYEMPAERVLEIDEMADLEVARVLARVRDQREASERLPAQIDAVIMDFDGVLTDNRVYTNQDGVESVACSRGDGMGLEQLRKAGVYLAVISKEQNPVVTARCQKLQIPCEQGIEGKLAVLKKLCGERGFALANVVYVGNDVNDLECLEAAGCGVAVADAHPDAAGVADMVLTTKGGHGALRELSDLVLRRMKRATQ